MSVVFESEPIPDFKGFVENLVGKKGYGLNSCPGHCPDRDEQHAHMREPGERGQPFIIWADGRFSGYDLTLDATLVYAPVLPYWKGMRHASRRVPGRFEKPSFGTCYQMAGGSMVHVKPDCRCPR